MNLGGNDLGFAEIISKCLNIIPFSADCNKDASVASFVSAKFGLLNGRFNRLAAALAGTPQSGDPGLDFTPAQVFLTAAPNPLRPSASTFCDGQPTGNYEANLTAAESRWAQDNVLVPLNSRFATRRPSTAGTSSTPSSMRSSGTRSARATTGSTRTSKRCASRASSTRPRACRSRSAAASRIPTSPATPPSAPACTRACGRSCSIATPRTRRPRRRRPRAQAGSRWASATRTCRRCAAATGIGSSCDSSTPTERCRTSPAPTGCATSRTARHRSTTRGRAATW